VEAPPKPSAFDPASMSQEEYLTKVLRMAPEDRQDEAQARAVQAHRFEVAKAAAGAAETISTAADVPAVVEVKSKVVPAAGVAAEALGRPAKYRFPGSPFKRFGGKGGHQGELAQWIVSLMVPHRTYAEPYCGTAAVLLARDPFDRRLWVGDTSSDRGVAEYVNDLDRGLSTFFQVLRSADGEELIARLQGVPFSEVEWLEAEQNLRERGANASPVDLAEWWYILCRQSRDGNLQDFAGDKSNRTRGGKAENVNAWLTAVHKTLPAVRARLLNVVVRCMPALDFIKKYDSSQTLCYADPPYEHAVRTSSDDYQHEMCRQDHGELLNLLRSVQGKVLLSGYGNELYDTVLSDWHRVEKPTKIQTGCSQRKSDRVEVLWLNYPPPPV
jgi:DNA adenine methylase